MTPESRRELVRLADLNLAAMIRHRMRTTAGALLEERDGLLLFSVGRAVASAHLNGALRLAPGADATELLARARPFFGAPPREFVVWTRDEGDADLEEGLRRAGFVISREPGIPCMVTRRRLDQGAPAPPDGIELRPVAGADDAEDYARVAEHAFDLAPDLARAIFAGPEGLLAPHVAAFVARSAGVPVASALTLQAEGVAGIYYVGTVPEARGRGLGELCTRAVTAAAFDRGARSVVLQASIMGEPLYRKMGYDLLGYYRWYRRPEK
jgi:ribosomal protein S18 acetylase RimI-like enzyme